MSATPWDEIWRDRRAEQPYWAEPERRVVELTAILRQEGRTRAAQRHAPQSGKRVYDVGCGIGRHAVFMAREGLEVCASDLSLEALERCRAWLAREGLRANLTQNDMEWVPYPNGFFDAVVAYHTIYHARWEKLLRTINALRQALKPGGYFLATLRSTKDSGCGQGRELERNTFMATSGDEESVVHHFCDERDVRELTRAFSPVQKELNESQVERDGKPHTSAHWVVLARTRAT